MDAHDLLLGALYHIEKKLSRGGGDHRSEEAENQMGQNDPIDLDRTSQKIATDHGVSEKTVRRAAKLVYQNDIEPFQCTNMRLNAITFPSLQSNLNTSRAL